MDYFCLISINSKSLLDRLTAISQLLLADYKVISFFLEIELVPQTVIWGVLGTIGTVGLAVSLVRWWMGIPTLLHLLLFSALFLFDLYDDLYPAIMRQDPNHILYLNLAIGVSLTLNFLGMVVSAIWRTRRQRENFPTSETYRSL